MSLLLDALKKAEAEKANSKQEDAEDLLEKTGEFFQASLQEELKALKEEENNTPVPATPKPSLSLEPLSPEEQNQEELSTNDESLSIATEKAVSENLSNEFEDNSKEEYTIDDTLNSLSSQQLVKDIGDEFNYTPVGAKTVFKAGVKNSSKNYSGLILLLLCFIGLFSFIGAYFYKVKPLGNSVIKSYPVAVSERTAVSIETTKQEDVVNSMEEAKSSEEQINIEPDQTVVMLESELDTSYLKQSLASEEPIGESSIESISINTVEEKVTEQTIISSETIRPKQPARMERLPETIKPSESAIKISKNSAGELSSQLINRAYLAFQAGNYTEAEQFYLQALKSEAENRDILLGLAAIALKKGDKELAYIHYLNLLDTNPGDEMAITGLLSISNKGEPEQNLNLIASLQKKKPEASYLDYILGNQYAKLQQWTKAQQAYFNAFSKDAFNPDYAFNLAVSLDQIGQYKSALNYYYSALELAEERNANFSPGSVFSRIDTLTTQINRIQ